MHVISLRWPEPLSEQLDRAITGNPRTRLASGKSSDPRISATYFQHRNVTSIECPYVPLW